MNHLRLLLPPADRPSSLRLLFLLHLFLLLLLFVLPPCRCDDSQIYTECRRRPPTCGGESFNISYPFVMSTDPPYCGHPDFHLSCDEENALTISIMEKQYKVLGIDYDNHSFTIADAESFPAGSCFWPSENLTLDPFLFPIDTVLNLNVTFLNCSRPNPNPILTYFSSPCLPGAPDSLYYYWSKDNSFSNDAAYQCRLVQFPISKAALNLNNVSDALLKGFALDWAEGIWKDCGVCLNSNGVCVSDESEEHVACYHCPDGMLQPDGSCLDRRTGSGRRLIMYTVIGTVVGVIGFLFVSALFLLFVHKRSKAINTRNIEGFLNEYGSLAPKRFKYSDMKRITKSFSKKLGEGGYGSVFEGELKDGRLVAVKILSKSTEDGEEFINEVASIGRTSHVNIVTLLGFCLDGRRRALIYEYMPNGSLDKYIHSDEPKALLTWDKLYQIAIGIARGLEYLHRGCNTKIVHFDIKPHNILLDEEFYPKISDFGLAKLCPQQESILSMADPRGTIGYMAPEVFSRHFGVASTKSDVYSYGMMVLEMAGGRKNVKASAGRSSEVYFPHWVYEHLDRIGDLQVFDVTEEMEEIARKMILVGLWCVQTTPANRPSMSRVVEMLEGKVTDVEMPPKPYISSPDASVDASPLSLVVTGIS